MSEKPHAGRPNWAALGVAAFLAAGSFVIFSDMGHLAGTAGYSQVGPTTVPRWIASVLAILAVLTAFSAFRDGPRPARIDNLPGVIWVIAGLILQIVLLMPAGFSIASGLMFALVARGFGEKRWYVSIPAGILIAFFVYAVFSQLLSLSLPAGPIERAIFG